VGAEPLNVHGPHRGTAAVWPTGCLARLGGYADRYSAALASAQAGQRAWVDGPDRDSCHLAWIQFHEDLLATLGIERGSDL
jgi:hypothetical protein